jgi:hypothetical protein
LKASSQASYQQTAIDAARNNPRRQSEQDGMAKWTIEFHDGTTFPYLTNDCRDREHALLGAIERFGKKVRDVY